MLFGFCNSGFCTTILLWPSSLCHHNPGLHFRAASGLPSTACISGSFLTLYVKKYQPAYMAPLFKCTDVHIHLIFLAHFKPALRGM